MQCLVLPSCIITGFFQELCVVRYMLALLSRKKIISKIQFKKLAQNCTLPISCKKNQIDIHFLVEHIIPLREISLLTKGNHVLPLNYIIWPKRRKSYAKTRASPALTHTVFSVTGHRTPALRGAVTSAGVPITAVW